MSGLTKNQQKAAELIATEIKVRMNPEDTDADAFAIGSSLTSESRVIDEAIRILNSNEQKPSPSKRNRPS